MALRTNDKIPVLAPGGGAVSADGTLLSTPYVTQSPYNELCWAACCAMIVGMFKGTSIALCQMVNIMFNTNSCQLKDLNDYDQPEWPDDVFGYYEYPYLYLRNSLTLGNIVYEISQGRPINVVLQWGSNDVDDGKHMIVISGYYSNGDVHVLNPMAASEAGKPGEASTGRIAYDHVKEAFGLGYWYGSYYNLTPPNARTS